MTTSDLQERQDAPDHSYDGAEAETSGELAKILHNITSLIAEADRRQEEALRELHRKLESLGQEARSVRGNVPDEYVQAFEQIEDGLNEIASQIVRSEDERRSMRDRIGVADTADASPPSKAENESSHQHVHADSDYVLTTQSTASPAAEEPPAPLRSGSYPSLRGTLRTTAVDPFDVVDSTHPGNPDDPWDADSAEALTKVYESLSEIRAARAPHDHETKSQETTDNLVQLRPSAEPARPDHPECSSSSTAAQGPMFDIGRDWLEARFAEIAAKVEQSLIELKSETPHSTLDTRFEQFESRFGQVMESVATRSDLENLREFETHLDDLAQHVEQAQLQLQRLDTIEAQLNTVMEKLSDQRLSQILEQNAPAAPHIDADRIAQQAAEQVAQRLAAVAPANKDDARRLDELREMLNAFMQERRHGEEQTAGMLDTMQQAMIRLLDRVDALEVVNHAEPQSQPEEPLAAHSNYEMPADLPGAQDQHASGHAEPSNAGSKNDDRADLRALEKPIDPALKVPAAETAEQEQSGTRPEVTRDQLIAEARRAMNAAAAKREAEAQAEADKSVKTKPGKTKAAKGETAGSVGGFSKSTRRIMVGACTLLLLSSAVLMLMPRKPRPPAPADQSTTQAKPSEKPGEAAPAAVAAPAPSVAPAQPPAEAKGPAQPPRSLEPEMLPSLPTQPQPMPPAKSSAIPPGFMPQSVPETGIDELSAPAGSPRDRAEIQEANGARAVFPGITMHRAPSQVGEVQRPRQQAQAVGQGRVVAAALPGQEQTQPAGARSLPPGDMPPVMIGPLSLRQAASKGDASAEFEVAARFAEGKGVPQDFEQAMRWYQRSASQGFGPAQYRLGTLYERGLGAKSDNARARIWYQRAAEQGHIKAMHNLAVLSASRDGASPDYSTAARWFNAAAERGLADSQYNLAVLYEGGLGVQKDIGQAYKWFAVAGRAGDKEATRRLDALRAKMSASEILAAEQLITDFQQKPVDRVVNDAFAAGEAWKKSAQADNQG